MHDQLFVDPDSIFIERETRQRKVVKIDDLIPSIRERGVLQPIIIEPLASGSGKHLYKLIAGERRLTTAKFLNMTGIPARLFSDLTETDRQLIELDENVRRQDLTWQERALACLRIHNIYMNLNAGKAWSETASAEASGFEASYFNRHINVAEALERNDEVIEKCDTIWGAINVLSRRAERNAASVVASVLETEADITGTSGPEVLEVTSLLEISAEEGEAPSVTVEQSARVPVAPKRSFSIQQASMEEFLANYSGRRFNFLHCDLPYGVALNGMANQNAFEGGGYESNPDIYYNLMRCLAEHWNKFMLDQSHIMFWISMEFYDETFSFFEQHLPQITLQKSPMIWHKTDNKGIIPDPMRQPRRIYEACLFGSTGDRKIVKPIGNAYGAPSSKEIHANEKPQPMLNHFLTMFVDETTRILDPTCGSGSAIRAAATLGAEYGLGLEINPEFADRAQVALSNQLRLAEAAKKAGQ